MPPTPFGQHLKDLRQKLDLTQQELGQRVGLSVAAIRKLESGERRPSKEVAEVLAKALAVPQTEHEAFIASARANTTHVTEAARSAIPNNLPGLLTSLIGREADLAAVLKRLHQPATRLLTLIGPGGVGKTRLALQVAESALGHFADGSFCVDLAPITDPDLLPSTILRTLGMADDPARTPLETLKQNLAEKSLLLVLDNFEQVTRAAPKVAELLAACPRLKALVTSREITHIRAEQPYALAPLAQAAAIELFVERAQHAKPTFTLTHDNAPVIHTLCQRLDGLPLAIELVAARMKLMTPQGILLRLLTAQGHVRNELVADGLSDLPARQHTLRDTIQWSYDLLNTDEQRAFRQLGIFVGGCTLEAAEAVLESPDAVAVWNALTSLLDKSLIQQREQDGDARFGMLETIREFAYEASAATDEIAVLKQRHAHYFEKWSAEVSPKLKSAAQGVWADQFELEHNNLRTALQFLLEGNDASGAARLGNAVQIFWSQRGYFNEGRQWLAKIWAIKPTPINQLEPAALWAGIAESLGWFADEQSDMVSARDFNEQSLSLAKITNEPYRIMIALNGLGNAYTGLRDLDTAQQKYLESLEIAHDLKLTDKIASLYSNLGNVCYQLNNQQGAYDYFLQSVALRRQLNDEPGLTLNLMNLAVAARHLGRTDEVDALFDEALRLARAHKLTVRVMRICINRTYSLLIRKDYEAARAMWREGMALNRSIHSPKQDQMGVMLAATLSGCDKNFVQSARLFGAAKTHATVAGGNWDIDNEQWFNEWSAPIRAALGEATFEREFANGQALSLEAAVQVALEVI